MLSFAVAALLAGAGLASAQNFSLSQGCQQTLEQIVASPDAACLNAGALASLAIGSSSSSSIVQPIDSWLSGLCSQAPCTNQTLSTVVTNVTNGCSSDLSSVGASVSSDSVNSIIQIVQMAYPTARNAVCLKDSSGTNCVTETLKNFEGVFGTLSISNIMSIVTKAVSGGSVNIPANITCTDCTKQMFNVINKDFSSQVSSLEPAIQSQCGQDFTNGATPSGVTESASTASAGSSSSSFALRAAPLMTTGAITGLAVSGLVAVASAVTFFA